jgi:hypothetical protein
LQDEEEMTPITDDSHIKALLTEARVIAVVGHSNRPHRTSYQIAQYLRRAGYIVYAVNPTINMIDGQKVYSQLADIPEPIDVVDVFRRSEYLPEVTREAIAVGAKAVWGQLGVWHDEAERLAEESGMPLIMDLCIKVEHARLSVGVR